jgi:hypothetical protein
MTGSTILCALAFEQVFAICKLFTFNCKPDTKCKEKVHKSIKRIRKKMFVVCCFPSLVTFVFVVPANDVILTKSKVVKPKDANAN